MVNAEVEDNDTETDRQAQYDDLQQARVEGEVICVHTHGKRQACGQVFTIRGRLARGFCKEFTNAGMAAIIYSVMPGTSQLGGEF